MKTLTIEHLAAYLPYGVKFKEQNQEPKVLTALYKESLACESDFSSRKFSRVKLILRPLTQLTEPITHNGETFVPIEKLHSLCEVDAEIEFLDCIEDDWRCAPDKMKYAPNTLMQIMLSWHFDIFNIGADNLCVYMNNDGTLAK